MCDDLDGRYSGRFISPDSNFVSSFEQMALSKKCHMLHTLTVTQLH